MTLDVASYTYAWSMGIFFASPHLPLPSRCGLQDFSPEPQSYDVIWIQWVIGEPVAPLCTFLPISAPAGGGPEAPQLLPPWGSTSKAHLFPHFVSTQYLLQPIWGQFFAEKNI